MFEFIQTIRIDPEAGRAEAVAHVPADYPAFADHFPGTALLPGSVLVELAAQTAGPLAEESLVKRLGLERWAMLGMIREAKFLRFSALPATVRLSAEVERVEPSRVITRVIARAEDHELLRAQLWMMMQDSEPGWDEAVAARRARVARWKAMP